VTHSNSVVQEEQDPAFISAVEELPTGNTPLHSTSRPPHPASVAGRPTMVLPQQTFDAMGLPQQQERSPASQQLAPLRWTDIAKGMPVFDGSEPLALPAWIDLIRQAFPLSNPELYRYRVQAARSLLVDDAALKVRTVLTMEWNAFAEHLYRHYDQDVTLYKAMAELKANQRYAGLSYSAAFDKAISDYSLLCGTTEKEHVNLIEVNIAEALCAIFPQTILRETGLAAVQRKTFNSTVAKLKKAYQSNLLNMMDSGKWTREGLNQAYVALSLPESVGNVAVGNPTPPSAKKKKPRNKSGKGLKPNAEHKPQQAFQVDVAPAESSRSTATVGDISAVLAAMQQFIDNNHPGDHF
ncbi:hypothetical protein LPJ73_001136, partial [Coemansia sp. RSA 2703]